VVTDSTPFIAAIVIGMAVGEALVQNLVQKVPFLAARVLIDTVALLIGLTTSSLVFMIWFLFIKHGKSMLAILASVCHWIINSVPQFYWGGWESSLTYHLSMWAIG
jgi:hypothetical protein